MRKRFIINLIGTAAVGIFAYCGYRLFRELESFNDIDWDDIVKEYYGE